MKQIDIDTKYFERQLQRCGITLRGLGRRMGMGHSQLSLTFHGKRRMQLEEAATLAKIFGVTLAEVAQHAGITLTPSEKMARVVAYMSGDGHVHPFDGGKVRMPVGLPTDTVAIQARTADTPLAWMDGWLMFARRSTTVDPDCVGRFCWVSTGQAESIGTLRHGYLPETYCLSAPGVIDSQPLEWASPILVTLHI